MVNQLLINFLLAGNISLVVFYKYITLKIRMILRVICISLTCRNITQVMKPCGFQLYNGWLDTPLPQYSV